METETWLIPLITFICGWKMAKGYYRVNNLLKLLSLMTGFISGTISNEKAREMLKDLKD